MFGCHKSEGTAQPQDDTSATVSSGNRSSWYKAFVLGGVVTIGPHALCALGLGTLASIGGYSIHQFCGDHDREADSSRGIEIRRLEKVPAHYTKFSELRSAEAREALIAAEPRFAEIIEAKRIEAEGKVIQVVFIESDDQAQVVICKEGAMCPCSKPQIYDVGSREDVIGIEKFPGQRKVLNALYGESDRVQPSFKE